MSQATLGSDPYRNSNLFSAYYLDERVGDLDAWDCDVEAQEAFDEIVYELYGLEVETGQLNAYVVRRSLLHLPAEDPYKFETFL